MGIGNTLKSLFAGSGASDDVGMVVIDGVALGESSGGRSMRPRDKVAVLKKLAVFVEKEGVTMTAILPAPPLREAADGADYRKITVRYTDGKADAAKIVGRIVKRAGNRSGLTVVTQKREVEEVAASLGAMTMRPATFKRALDPQGDGRRGKPSGRKRRPQKQGDQPEKIAEEQQTREPQDENERIVNSLIDTL